MAILLSNFASGRLLSDISAVDTLLTLYVGEGNLFPAPVGSDYAVLIVEDVIGNKEIMHMTTNLADVLTVIRAQESTSAVAFLADSRVELRITTGFLEEFIDGGTF